MYPIIGLRSINSSLNAMPRHNKGKIAFMQGKSPVMKGKRKRPSSPEITREKPSFEVA
jgi:hypothetical protein